MKVAFFNIGTHYNNTNQRPRYMFSEALLMHNIDSVAYARTDKGKEFVLRHTDGKTCTIVLPGQIPLLSKVARRKGKGIVRKITIALENIMFVLQVVRRLPRDKCDLYIITHLWDYEIPFINIMLRVFRPTVIMWLGGSLRWYEQTNKWRYHIFVSIFRISLRLASLILISLDLEQEYYLFKILKLPKNKVISQPINPAIIVDDKLFRKLDRDISAKKVGFDEDVTNIVMISRIESTQRVSSCKDYEKDPFTALEIFRCLAQKNPKVKMHIFGDGSGMGEFKRRVKQYNLQDKVKMYGFIKRDLLPEYYSAADLTLYPHPLITINDGTANFESMLCGTPVVYFKRYPWVKTEHQGGFAIDREPELGARQILSRLNPTYLQRKREEAASIPRDFTIEAFGEHMTKILRHLLKSKSDREVI
jgi:glycosyltransferase involved in cell wall biosynthesis